MNIDREQTAKVYDPALSADRKNTCNARLSVYQGKDIDGKSSFGSWFANFVGKAFDKAKGLKGGEVIVLREAVVKTFYNKESKKASAAITVFDFDIKGQSPETEAEESFIEAASEIEIEEVEEYCF